MKTLLLCRMTSFEQLISYVQEMNNAVVLDGRKILGKNFHYRDWDFSTTYGS